MRHPNIVQVLAFSVSPICMVMERMDRSLYDLIGAGVTLNMTTKMTLLIGVTEVSYPLYDASWGDVYPRALQANRQLDHDVTKYWVLSTGHLPSRSLPLHI